MSRRSLQLHTVQLAVAACVAVALAGGCKKEEEYVPNPKGNPLPEVKGADGGGGMKMPTQAERTFGAAGCTGCHSAGPSNPRASGPNAKGKGPDLAKVGADPAHTPEWFRAHIRDPQSQNPEAKMPKHDESKVSDQDLEVIVRYLSSLK